MDHWLNSLLQYSFVAFSSIFFLVDPFAAIPAFLVMTADEGRCNRKRSPAAPPSPASSCSARSAWRAA